MIWWRSETQFSPCFFFFFKYCNKNNKASNPRQFLCYKTILVVALIHQTKCFSIGTKGLEQGKSCYLFVSENDQYISPLLKMG